MCGPAIRSASATCRCLPRLRRARTRDEPQTQTLESHAEILPERLDPDGSAPGCRQPPRFHPLTRRPVVAHSALLALKRPTSRVRAHTTNRESVSNSDTCPRSDIDNCWTLTSKSLQVR